MASHDVAGIDPVRDYIEIKVVAKLLSLPVNKEARPCPYLEPIVARWRHLA